MENDNVLEQLAKPFCDLFSLTYTKFSAVEYQPWNQEQIMLEWSLTLNFCFKMFTINSMHDLCAQKGNSKQLKDEGF